MTMPRKACEHSVLQKEYVVFYFSHFLSPLLWTDNALYLKKGNEIHGVVFSHNWSLKWCLLIVWKNWYARIYSLFFVPVVSNMEVCCWLAGPAGGRVQGLANWACFCWNQYWKQGRTTPRICSAIGNEPYVIRWGTKMIEHFIKESLKGTFLICSSFY